MRMLREKFLIPERLGEFLCADGLVAVLELVEDPLQCQGNTLGGVVALRRHHVDRLQEGNKPPEDSFR